MLHTTLIPPKTDVLYVHTMMHHVVRSNLEIGRIGSWNSDVLKDIERHKLFYLQAADWREWKEEVVLQYLSTRSIRNSLSLTYYSEYKLHV